MLARSDNTNQVMTGGERFDRLRGRLWEIPDDEHPREREQDLAAAPTSPPSSLSTGSDVPNREGDMCRLRLSSDDSSQRLDCPFDSQLFEEGDGDV